MTRAASGPEDQARRRELWKARAAGRFLVEAWERIGCPELVEQGRFCTRAGLTDAKTKAATINKWFPRAVVEDGGRKLWSMEALRSVLRWDDPVMMLKPLATAMPQAWWGPLGEAETKPTSQAQEEVVRRAFDELRMTVVRVEDPLVVVDWKAFSENDELRLK